MLITILTFPVETGKLRTISFLLHLHEKFTMLRGLLPKKCASLPVKFMNTIQFSKISPAPRLAPQSPFTGWTYEGLNVSRGKRRFVLQVKMVGLGRLEL